MTRHRAIFGFGGPLPNGNRILDLALTLIARRSPGQTRHAAPTQMRDQLVLQGAASLHEQATIDRLVGNLHGWFVSIPAAQPRRYLLGRPVQPQLARDRSIQRRAHRQSRPLRALGSPPRHRICLRGSTLELPRISGQWMHMIQAGCPNVYTKEVWSSRREISIHQAHRD